MNIQHYMSLALQLAEQGRYTVSPNPMVGCVIVKNNQIVGQGYHQRAGEPHAEVYALREAGAQANGATAYVTLEPCCHQGLTAPCTAALIAAGIKNIYVASIDPNPLMAGKSITMLRAAGINVEVGCCEVQAQQMNEIFFYYMTHQRPFVIAKWAMSLDGKTSVYTSDNRQISGSESQFNTHQLRQQVDAILIGARTAYQDDPQLTVRLSKTNILKQPIRIILTGKQVLPPSLKIFNAHLPGKTILVVTEQNKHLFSTIPNVELLIVPQNEHQQISLTHLLQVLAQRKITSLLVEGGMTVHESFFRENLVNKVQVFLAPTFIGSLEKKRPMHIADFSQLGKDFLFTAS